MRFDVNETLLRHLATGGGAASALRSAADPDLAQLVAELFDARSDIRRLDKAQQVARRILQVNDFADIMELRDIVAQQELRRLINYSKQKDHTVHTVYLYLLGIWFFDNVSDLHTAVRVRSGARNESDACDWFLFQWLFASLLHDIGYAFYDLSRQTKSDRTRIDNIYSFEWIEKMYGADPVGGRCLLPDALQEFKEVHSKWHKRYFKAMGTATSKLSSDAQKEVLDRLAAAPWLEDLEPAWKDLDIFSVLAPDGDSELREYAERVAEHGYTSDGKEGYVDHAVASGLLLFQYMSYWYWLMQQLPKGGDTYNSVAGNFDYDLKHLKSAVEGCRAVAYHNVQTSVKGADKILSKITLKAQPVLYLAIVCDELQSWDRPPAGEAVLRHFQKTANTSLEGPDIELACTGTDKKVATVRVGHRQKTDILKALRETLERRLPGFEQIVKLAD